MLTTFDKLDNGDTFALSVDGKDFFLQKKMGVFHSYIDSRYVDYNAVDTQTNEKWEVSETDKVVKL